MSTNDPLESELQRNAYNYALSRGWFAEKVMRTRRRGFPDYYFLRDGRTVLMEFKRSPDEEPTAQQLKRHKEIREHGGEVFVVDTLELAMEILR